ncbi:MAG TPA: NHL repeat-containing protein [Solirubrobacterales bacterium]|nr:NHL repeat-containing protein [Solirubrobacterales bacterium]
MDSPSQLAVAPDGDVYVADTGHDKIEVYSGDGDFLRSFGAGSLDGPEDVALDDDGRAYVADTGNHRIDVFSSSGAFVRSFGDEAGEGELVEPVGLDVDASMFGSTVYVADAGNNLIASYEPDGDFIESFGSVSSPRDVVVGSGGNLFVADAGNERITVLSKEGNPVRFIGEGGPGKLSEPVALAVDALGGIYVADRAEERIFHFTADGGFLGSVEAAPKVTGVGVACQSNVFATEATVGFARVERFGEPGTPAPPCLTPPTPIVAPPTPVVVSNAIRFNGLRLNRRSGTAVVFVRVPGPGRVILHGRGLRRLARYAGQARRLALLVRPKVRLMHFLRRHGKGRIRVEVTFKPDRAEPKTIERVVVLRRHRHRR